MLPPSPPEIVDDVPEYEAEEILDLCVKRQKVQYLVKWKGYPQEESTWEPSENLEHSTQLVKNFYQKNSGAPQQLNFGSIFIPYKNLTVSTINVADWTDGKWTRKERVIMRT